MFVSVEHQEKMVGGLIRYYRYETSANLPSTIAPADLKTAIWFYVGLEGFGSVSLVNEPDESGLEGTVQLEGSIPRLGDFKIDVTSGPESNKAPRVIHPTYWAEKPLDRTLYHSVKVPEDQVWNAKGWFAFIILRRDKF